MPSQSSKREHTLEVVTSGGLGTIHPIPIGYGFRPRLRGRLTLRGLALRRNPWTSGGRGSHPPCRYSCPHSHFPYLQHASQRTFTGLGNAPLPRTSEMCTHSFGTWLEPRYIFAAEQLLDQ